MCVPKPDSGSVRDSTRALCMQDKHAKHHLGSSPTPEGRPFCFYENKSCYLAQAGFKLRVPLPEPLQGWDCRCALCPAPVTFSFSKELLSCVLIFQIILHLLHECYPKDTGCQSILMEILFMTVAASIQSF